MRIRGSSFFLRWISLVFVLLAAILLVFQLIQYSLSRSNYPSDMTIGGVPVGGLTPQAAEQRVLQVYALPVEIHYGDAVIDLDPGLIGFQVNIDSILAAADLQRTGASFWGGFWDYLWGRRSPASQIPLVASYSEQRLRSYLENDISARYDRLPIPARPIPGTDTWTASIPGQTIDVDRAVILIDAALKSPDKRVVIVASQNIVAGRPSLQDLQTLLKQIISESGFDGVVDLYFRDLQTSETVQFATEAGLDLPVDPDISFTASSTIKIPVMVAVMKHYNSKLDADTVTEMKNMIARSDNVATDALMHQIDQIRGPLVVTEDMQQLGLNNTFLAGFFAPGSPALDHFVTPANSRLDVNTNPDIYSQTTPSDMGMLLEDIYLCAQTGGGSLVAAFPGQIDRTACQAMIEYLQEDKLGALIQGGVPEGTVVAHKHGWDISISHISDAGIVYTPGGNYVLTIYVYKSTQAIWDIASPMIARLSRAIYNYYNPSP